MPHPNYPDSSDVTTFLTEAGFDVSTLGTTVATQLATAIANWERETGWLPFLAGPANAVRTFHPPGPNDQGGYRGGSRTLYLRGGLLSLASLQTHVDTTPVTLTVNSDFWLGPEEAPDMGEPWRWVEFRRPQWGNPRSIQINGQWGRVAQVPDDVWGQLLMDAGVLLTGPLGQKLTGGLLRYEEAGVVEQYSATPLTALKELWGQGRSDLVAQYRRIELY